MYIFLVFYFLFINIIFSEVTSGLNFLRNEGETIFETGNKFPNLSGIRGGSRITYSNYYNKYGFSLGYSKDRLNFNLSYLTTMRYQNSRSSRDEDFLLGSNSIEQGNKLDTKNYSLNDTAHTFSGTRNFADAYSRTSLFSYNLNFKFNYYFGNSSQFSTEKTFFITSGLYYTYTKYILYDVMQYIDPIFTFNNRPFLGPIGFGLTYAQASTEIPIGFGYRFAFFDKVKFEPSISILYGFARARDFHYQRNLNFIANSNGPGFTYNAEFFYILSDVLLLKLSYNGHRFFSDASFRTKGGFSYSDILSNYVGSYRAYISTKEIFYEFSIIYKLKD